MTIEAWHMSVAEYGHVNAGLTQSMSQRQFMKYSGDRGSGLYRDLNPTDGSPVSVGWDLTDLQYSNFLAAWQDTNKICFGSNWVTIDLPLMMDLGQLADETRYEQATAVVALDVASGATAGYAPLAVAGGGVAPRRVWSHPVTELSVTSGGVSTVKFGDGVQTLGNPSNMLINWNTDTYGPEYIRHDWNGSVYMRDLTSIGRQPVYTWLNSTGGQKVSVDIRGQAPVHQRYRCHFGGTYRASWLGYEWWRLTANLEVDLAEGFVTA